MHRASPPANRHTRLSMLLYTRYACILPVYRRHPEAQGEQLVIDSFKNKGTEDVFNVKSTREARKTCPEVLWRVARRKLNAINAAVALKDLRVPPGNHLEALKDDRADQYSIRINDQYRICFEWSEAGAGHVEIVDYH